MEKTAGNSVRVSVIDNGIGIPPENLSRIFEHGFTTRKSGHGFGLHSGALTARELGGALTAHSDGLGTGAKFVLELPIEPRKADPMTPPVVEKNLRILVVDDNRAVHDDFRKILCSGQESSAGLAAAEELLFGEPAAAGQMPAFEIDSAYQGEEGLAKARQAAAAGRPYALAFVDVRMPPGLGRRGNLRAPLGKLPGLADRHLHRLLRLFLERHAGPPGQQRPVGHPQKTL